MPSNISQADRAQIVALTRTGHNILQISNETGFCYMYIISTSFVTLMNIGNHIALEYLEINQEDVDIWRSMPYLIYTIAYMFAMFVPCLHDDQLTKEVHRLRRLLASRLNSDDMDKQSRGAARALMVLAEQNDLSFSLFGMFKVNTSLPIKYISLFITYLIILLQFEKVLGRQI